MTRYVCVHGHFYQPERENPWLETIESQDSAYPYHDWNERVTAECYAPNAVSRILDARGRIVRIVNNYARISFNVGPTLLDWLEEKDPGTYRAIVDADASSRERFGGHGSAMAQVYNHMILPLASARDRRTQVLWGLRDFEHRFGRRAEAMWLPETAVDLESLEALAAAGIRFTVLAPHQAARVRPLGAGEDTEWTEVPGGRVDPTRPYLQRLPSGREIVLFFYDGPVSRALAFEGLLRDGERFAERLLGLFSDGRDWSELVHVATDGETYGHHHRHGEMALSYALERIVDRKDVRLTNYSEYLALHPPDHEVEVVEETSWSCAHGIERWRSDCGCSTGGEPGWNQAWRRPLREALDWLRDRLAPRYEERAGRLLRDPWAARDAYLDLVLDRGGENRARFFAEQGAGELDEGERLEALKLLELQRQAMLMYTSCGWFFTDLAGIETVQVLEYAGRAVQLAEGLFEEPVEPGFVERLARARSNDPGQGDGRRIYEDRVKPKVVTLEKVCAHHALSSLFDPVPERSHVYCYAVSQEAVERDVVGRAQLLVGVARVESEITRESGRYTYAALHFGAHHAQGGVRLYSDPEAFDGLRHELSEAFGRAELADAIRLMDDHFGDGTYSLASLFRDEQRRIVGRLLESTLEEVESVYRQLYQRHAPLRRFLARLELPQPHALELAGEFVLNVTLRRLLEDRELDLDRIGELLEDAQGQGVELDAAGLGLLLRGSLERLAGQADAAAADGADAADPLQPLQRLARGVDLALAAPFPADLWHVQNVYWRMLQESYPRLRRRAEEGDDEEAVAWMALFRALGEKLSVALDG